MKQYTIDYEVDGRPFQGQLVVPPRSGDRVPGILMAPNWMGVTEAAVERAMLLAEAGYVVLVADLYGTQIRPKDFGEAAALADPIRAAPLLARARMLKALQVLDEEGSKRGVLAPRGRAAVGFCFGGGNVLELARAGSPIQAAISIHGDLTTPMLAKPGDIRAGVLALHGSTDPVAPKEQRDAFEAEMTACGARWQMHVFGNVLHAYTDVGINAPGVAEYDACASEWTYALTYRFITEAFARETR